MHAAAAAKLLFAFRYSSSFSLKTHATVKPTSLSLGQWGHFNI